MRTFVSSVVCVVALAAVCVGKPLELELELEPEFWFTDPVQEEGLGARLRRASWHPGLDSVCRSMNPGPGHNNSRPQPGPAPFGLGLTSNWVEPGGTIKVIVWGQHPFKGLYIQARDGDTPVGTFLENDNPAVRLSSCPPGTDNALSYISRSTAIDNLQIEWVAPNTLGKEIVFRATFVESFRVFWLGVESLKVRIEEPY